ncbi:MAG: type III pantothenate kinase [Candidatus Bipolaricaulota bacterium]|nr:type III pantothenate kinase [Candidatus Bipolaricaulota bacterium]MCS7274644.1 type III pantothenate kinase [Candidatus Bipolaricaulota bacterium]MDW8110925.1 type III pantothenate kinase [Candidatus Bipolaricaulota bacterium]MDW8329114.1 type III pantothenate kinase [Candidatus Bipolaricaulota bacterium]
MRVKRTQKKRRVLLALDVGNTMTKLGLFRSEKLLADFQLASNRERTADELGLQIKALLHDLDPPEDVIISSVVPHLNAALARAFERHFHLEPQFLSHRWGLIKLDVEEPSKVGADRIADSIGGFHLYGGPLLTINFGTATVFNLISKEGHFLGGAIAPQMEMAAAALTQRAAQLYEVELQLPNSVIGKTTEDNIRAGFVLGFLDLVRGLIERFRREARAPLRVVATGGRGEFFAKHLPEISHYDPYLTLKGLRIAWQLHQERNTAP